MWFLLFLLIVGCLLALYYKIRFSSIFQSKSEFVEKDKFTSEYNKIRAIVFEAYKQYLLMDVEAMWNTEDRGFILYPKLKSGMPIMGEIYAEYRKEAIGISPYSPVTIIVQLSLPHTERSHDYLTRFAEIANNKYRAKGEHCKYQQAFKLKSKEIWIYQCSRIIFDPIEVKINPTNNGYVQYFDEILKELFNESFGLLHKHTEL